MKTKLLGAVAALCLGAPLAAADFTYDIQLTLDQSQLDQYGFYAHLPGGPLEIAPGDTVHGTISFVGHGDRLVVFDAGDPQANEFFVAGFGGNANSGSSWSLLGVQGDYVGPAVQQLSSGGFSFGSFGNLTNSSFSFTGISYTLESRANGPVAFDPTDLVFVHAGIEFGDGTAAAPSPSPVPEPATWAMMIAGFGAIGASLRRRPAARALAA